MSVCAAATFVTTRTNATARPARCVTREAVRMRVSTLSTREAHTNAAVDQTRRSRCGRLELDVVLLVERVLHAEEHLEVAAEITREAEVHHAVWWQAGLGLAGFGALVEVVVELAAEEHAGCGNGQVARVRVRHAHRSTVLRHLREVQTHERRVGFELGDLGVVEQIAAGQPQRRVEANLDVVLPSANTGATEVLPLLKVGADRDVRDRVLDPVVVPGRADRRITCRLDPDACLTAEEPLGAEVLIRERAHETDTELAIELVQRRRAESITDIAPDRHAIGDAIERRDARADNGVISILER